MLWRAAVVLATIAAAVAGTALALLAVALTIALVI